MAHLWVHTPRLYSFSFNAPSNKTLGRKGREDVKKNKGLNVRST